jgi:hypothetical protein
MAQTQNALPMSCFRVRLSTDCLAWTIISGETNSVTPDAVERMVGEAYTFDGLRPIIKAGKMQPANVTFKLVYTEMDTEAYIRAKNIFESVGCGADVCVAWSPGGGDVGDDEYTVKGVLKTFNYPSGDAGAAGPIMADFVVYGNITSTTLTT